MSTTIWEAVSVLQRCLTVSGSSTPTAGVKAGYMMSFGVLGDQRPLKDFGEMSVFEIEPNVGWSWAFNGDLGMRLSIGATVLVGSQWTTAVMPKLSVGFEF